MRGCWSETKISDRQRPNRKNLKRSNSKLFSPYQNEPDYFDDAADMLNEKYYREKRVPRARS